MKVVRRTFVVVAAFLLLLATPVGVASATAPNPPPQVIPSLTNWSGGQGTVTLSTRTRILVQPRAVRVHQDALEFARELEERTGHRPRVVRGLAAARPGDLVLEVDPQRHDLGGEGYDLHIDDVVHVTGATPTGVFYGTRTILQVLATTDALPRGRTIDVPTYPERGVGVCACYIHVSMAWFERLMRDMAYLKLNQLWIEAKVKSDRYPGTVFWGYYTKDEVRRLSALARKYHITLVPEINSPGHIDPYLENYPELQLVDRYGNRQPSRLDITKPEAFDFLTGLIDEALEVWDTPYWHMGADEYMLGSAYEDYPHILEYAREKFGPDATPQDAFVDFINRVNAHVKSKGKTLRIWNDGLAGENTIPLDPDIVVEHWDGRSHILRPSQLLEAGHRVMNSSYALYLVRGGFQTDTRQLYETDWTPLRFENETLTARHPDLTGAKITMWPDNGRGHTENEVEVQAFMPLRHLALTTWGGPKPTDSYDEFVALAEAIGHAPGWENIDRQPLPAGTYAFVDVTPKGARDVPPGGDRLAPLAAEPGAAAGFVAGSSATWDLLPTSDGYYRLRSTGTDVCLTIEEGRRYLNVPLEAGAPFTLIECSTAASQKTQRWQLVPGPGGAVRLVNAVSQLPVTRGEADVAVQMPPDERTPALFTAVPLD
ncbi:family 20 glycosylhydrolase [Thermasporomyces composti]|jgi:hexosaminidase|uniref:Hexosaminidase n=1 Tax=Thermasporomyces composti TaxID=696763 RepID=A0A3D9V442_THECX|nr:family 20 glycosylhydrolase [Thermasporomyces composti]REF36592.1 hexosaminidase [Thermasporomyces composti]